MPVPEQAHGLPHLGRVPEAAPAGGDGEDDPRGPAHHPEVVEDAGPAHVDGLQRQLQGQHALDVDGLGRGAIEERLRMRVVVEAPGAGHPRLDPQGLHVLRSVGAVDDLRGLGPRPDDRHLAPQHVQELGQLVQLAAPQEGAEREEAKVARRGDHASLRPRPVVHRPELEHREGPAVEADALRAVEDRPRAAQPDAERDQREQRADHRQHHGRDEDVNQPRDHSCSLSSPS